MVTPSTLDPLPPAEAVHRRVLRRHFSPFLTWVWHFQDFELRAAELQRSTFELKGHFAPRFAPLLHLSHLRKARSSRLGLPTSVRLANHAALVAAGLLLRKFRKDGDVIAERFSIRCAEPIYYSGSTRVPVNVRLHSLTESKAFYIYHASFSLGERGEHAGELVHHYSKSAVSPT